MIIRFAIAMAAVLTTAFAVVSTPIEAKTGLSCVR